MTSKIEVVILGNENADESLQWINACKNAGDKIRYRIVNLSGSNWLEEIEKAKFDYLLAKPPGLTTKFKELYDERIYILERSLGYKVFPTAEEIFIYENKRFLSFWLSANKIPHPKTFVFYDKAEALGFVKSSVFPIVGKVNIGASGRGVWIIKNEAEAKEYVKSVFSGKGAKKEVGPNFKKNNFLKRGFHYILNPADIIKKLKKYKGAYQDKQTDFVIFQEFVPHNFEWRVVRIGDSFFAHKKIVKGEKASGSLIKSYENPPLSVLDFVKKITDKHNLFSQAIDLFESGNNYLVNEMQCIFGQSDTFQMMVDGKKGRYVFKNNNWLFEEGDFNENECYNLRLDWVLQQINNETKK